MMKFKIKAKPSTFIVAGVVGFFFLLFVVVVVVPFMAQHVIDKISTSSQACCWAQPLSEPP